MSDKVVRDGQVAVIVSPGYGGGWSTWGDGNSPFDPTVVEWIENGKPNPMPYEDADDYRFTGGLHQAVVEWLPVGAWFYIEEYDGHENLIAQADGRVA